MRKVPVLGTVSRAYGFLLGEFATILRLAWAPLLIGAGISYLYGGQAVDATIAAGVNADPARAMEYAPVQLLIGLVNFVTGIMATVVVFGDRKPGLFVYVWLGGTEARLILVTILLVIAVVAGGVAATLVFAALAALSVVIPVMGLVVAIGAIAFAVVAVWAALRLSLISPVVVAENNLGVERSWALTRGNALRLLAVLLLTLVPYLIVAFLVATAILGSDMPAFPVFPVMAGDNAAKSAAAVQEASQVFADAVEHWQLNLMKAVRAHWAEVCIAGFFGNAISTALWAGALGSAYNAAVGGHKE